MKRFSIFNFLTKLCLFQHFIVDNDDGAPSNEENIEETSSNGEDIGDVDINENNDGETIEKEFDDEKEQKENDNKEDIKNEIKGLKKQIDELNAYKEVKEGERARDDAIKQLCNKHKGFDGNKVKNYLIELNKSNPEKANMLNNPVGWENIWLNEFIHKDVHNDNPSFGRNEQTVDRSQEVLEKVKDGEWLSVEDELELYGKHL